MEEIKTKRKIREGTKKASIIAVILVITFSLFNFNIQDVQATEQSYIVTIDSQSYDGVVYKSYVASYGSARNATTGTGSADSGTSMTVGQANITGTYYVYRDFLFFDTSSIPDDATIDNATLSIKTTTTLPALNFNLSVQNGQPTYPHTPITTSDYYLSYYSGDGGNISTSTMSASTYFNISLTSTGITWLDLDSTTKLCLRSDADINNTAPVGDDRLDIYTTEQGTTEAPKLYIGYTLDYEYSVVLYGPYDEDGTRNYDGINCTFTRPNQATLNFELNGTESKTAQTDTRLVISSDIGNNYSRVYYLRYDQWYEEIYIFYPDDIYATYEVTFLAFIEVTNGYLETILNINGTDRIIERQRVDTANEIPFVLSWGTSYKFRLICDEGTHVWESVVAGSDTDITLAVTSDDFPADAIHIGNITLSATRESDISINVLYDDEESLTNWVYISFTELGETTAEYYTNNTGSTHNITWSDALPAEDYTVYFAIDHEEEGTITYSIVVAQLIDETNPWDFSWMGSWGGIDSTQLMGLLIVLAVFGGFSIGSVDVGIITMLITAAILIVIGWLDITWSFFTIVVCIGIISVVSIRKHQKGAG